MKKESEKLSLPNNEKEKSISEGYPLYPPGDDIYNKYNEEQELDPDNPSTIKESVKIERAGTRNEKDFSDDETGTDLDVPGSELDDEQEEIGSEDEENNYYSLGGDDHNNLDEDKGE